MSIVPESTIEVKVNGRQSFIVGRNFFHHEGCISLYDVGYGLIEHLFGTVQPVVPEKIVTIRKFRNVSPDLALANLDVISFTHFWEALRIQGYGGSGALLVDSRCPNFARIMDKDGNPLIVSAYWDPMIDIDMGGWASAWCMDASPTDSKALHLPLRDSFATLSY